MKQAVDLTGQTFGGLTALRRRAPYPDRRWVCRCVCGSEVLVTDGNLKSKLGSRPVCRCEQRRKAQARQTTHGQRHTGEYQVWVDMRRRCESPRHASYSDYGGRGIRVDPRWRSFEAFRADIGPRPSPNHSVEREDVNGPYAPWNCHWATRGEQANNKRNNVHLTFRGKTQTLAQWAREVGLHPDALQLRLSRLKWPVERALTTPPRGWGPGRPKGSA